MKLLRFLTLLSLWPQSHQKKVKACSAAPSFPFVRIHYRRIDTPLPPPKKPTNPEWETVNLREGRRKRLRLAQEWITSHLKSSHYVLKPEGSSVFLCDRTTSEMYCKIIRSKQAGKMSDALLFISWAGLVPATLQTAAVSAERVEVEINPICVFFPRSFISPKTWWTIISAAEKRQNSTPSSSSLASHSIYIQV